MLIIASLSSQQCDNFHQWTLATFLLDYINNLCESNRVCLPVRIQHVSLHHHHTPRCHFFAFNLLLSFVFYCSVLFCHQLPSSFGLFTFYNNDPNTTFVSPHLGQSDVCCCVLAPSRDSGVPIAISFKAPPCPAVPGQHIKRLLILPRQILNIFIEIVCNY